MGYVFNPLLQAGLDQTGGAGGGGTPGGSTTQVQFNDAGAFAGDADLTWNKTTNVFGITGDVNLSDGGTYTTTLQTITPTAARTISFPDATGTVALVGGSSGQLLYNNAGANAGASTLTYDGAILTSSGRFINSYNATASSPAKAFTGTFFTGGTATTTKPHVLIEPTGTTSTGWSTSGTGLGVNAASGFAGNLLDLQVNGTRVLNLTATGTAVFSSSNGAASVFGGGGGANLVGSFATIIDNSTSIASHGRSRIRIAENRVTLSFLNTSSAEVDGLLTFGDNTSGFPGLKRSGTTLQARLANDSAYTTIDAQHRLQGTAPANATATGTAGDIRYDADYIYICTATNTWKRAAISTWP